MDRRTPDAYPALNRTEESGYDKVGLSHSNVVLSCIYCSNLVRVYPVAARAGGGPDTTTDINLDLDPAAAHLDPHAAATDPDPNLDPAAADPDLYAVATNPDPNLDRAADPIGNCR